MLAPFAVLTYKQKLTLKRIHNHFVFKKKLQIQFDANKKAPAFV